MQTKYFTCYLLFTNVDINNLSQLTVHFGIQHSTKSKKKHKLGRFWNSMSMKNILNYQCITKYHSINHILWVLRKTYEYVSLIFCLSLIFHVFNFILNSQITDLNLSHSQLDSGSLIGSIKVCNTFYSLEWCFHMICEIWKYHLYSCFNVSKKS